MKKGIIGRKVGMTQIFDGVGNLIPVTVIEAGPCVVVQKKTLEKDGYAAVQLGFSDVKEKRLTRPEKGHLEKAGVPMKKVLGEFRLEDTGSLNVGDTLLADVFAEGERVDVTGISKGKGYAGTVKRYGNSRGRMSHGGGPVHRHAGSMGANSSPSRIFKNKRLPGHMGSDQVTVLNLDVARVDAEHGIIALRGAVPGARGSIVYLRDSVK